MSAVEKIGLLIQERRDNMKITQFQLAEIADLGINTIYKIETGQANPTLKSLQKITDILGLEITLQVKNI
ncbi:helix-turn-helix domain-containing protein [Christiangramia sp. OXR-203]|uniref:helix-turn-helix domain-containing protein n=1 Tax=Christiangramia sp. OXR-203 TaxID=3100176 RepID=UPI002AC8CBB5|nr:helix-turn-helix domain-containing protein [Christiangramia sp. OXR-203]WPY99840.1 helix-turn-helix domain-containing protein [Christiangramia sp. OXR-203]